MNFIKKEAKVKKITDAREALRFLVRETDEFINYGSVPPGVKYYIVHESGKVEFPSDVQAIQMANYQLIGDDE